jgi:hypothetical protein
MGRGKQLSSGSLRISFLTGLEINLNINENINGNVNLDVEITWQILH